MYILAKTVHHDWNLCAWLKRIQWACEINHSYIIRIVHALCIREQRNQFLDLPFGHIGKHQCIIVKNRVICIQYDRIIMKLVQYEAFMLNRRIRFKLHADSMVVVSGPIEEGKNCC